MLVFAIDPGDRLSAYCLVQTKDYKPVSFGKVENDEIRKILFTQKADHYVIERIRSYGMSVGRDVFETCEWVGRFSEIIFSIGADTQYVYRMEEKTTICHDSKANDANIRRALIDQFARFDLRSGKGTKKKPDFFYGFHADVWAAYSVAYTFIKTRLEG